MYLRGKQTLVTQNFNNEDSRHLKLIFWGDISLLRICVEYEALLLNLLNNVLSQDQRPSILALC